MQLPRSASGLCPPSLTWGCIRGRLTTAQRHRYRFSRCVCWQYLASTHNRRTYARCFAVAT
ncbi:hypothetical protein FDK15_11255, partial [Geobacillus thermoleovorans]